MKLKSICLLLAALMLLAASCAKETPVEQPNIPDAPVGPDEPVIQDGTEDHPYLIADAAQLEELMNRFKNAEQPADKNSFKIYFRLTQDIDASDIEWTPLNGSGSFYKAMDFDGNNHTISNLSVSGTYASFAGVLYGSIRNVVFSNATIDGGDSDCGVVAGLLGNEDLPGFCENVIVTESTVTGSSYIGGFAGRNRTSGTVTGCRVSGGTINQSATTDVATGGFVAYSGENASYKDCSSTAVVNSSAEFTGGFAGRVSGPASFNNCSAGGNVTGVKHVGGFVGQAEKSSFTNCLYSEGTVSDSFSGRADTGGFCGYVTSDVSFTHCLVTNATVSAPSAQRIGGFIGQLGEKTAATNNCPVFQCAVTATSVTGGLNTGGFAGVQYDNIERSFVSGGTVTAQANQCGGFSAFVQYGNVYNCFSTAAVDGSSYSQVGGFAGIAYKTVMSSCYAAGTVTGGSDVGAFIGKCAQQGSNLPPTIKNCIGWHASLPFFGSNEVSATISNCYAGNEGTVSSHAVALGWKTTVWDLTSGSLPTLLRADPDDPGPDDPDEQDGTQTHPYLIADATQLEALMNLFKNAEQPADKNSFKIYFRLTQDIDASDIEWTPLNGSGSFYKAMDFDGNNHTISNLSVSGNYASFAGVLYGSIRNVTFRNATINGGSTKCGVIAGFLGTDGLPAFCENVIITESTVTGTSYVGGFAGHTRNIGTVTGCRVENTILNGTSYLGGFTAYVDLGSNDKYDVPVIFTRCQVSDVTINQNITTDSSISPTGGFVAYTGQAASFIECSVKATITANKANLENVGGFLGISTYAGPTFTRCQVLSGTTIAAKALRTGGFVGSSEVATSYKECSSAAVVNNSAEFTGGFAGSVTASSFFNACTAIGNVTGIKHVGGFVGQAENASFTNCLYNEGTVTDSCSGRSDTGGFCGYVTSGVSFKGCMVKNATVSALSGQRVGGFIGQLGATYKSSNNCSVVQCSVTETSVTGSTNTGGFVGVQYDNIERSFVSGGTVTARANRCGGFSAYLQTGNATNCFTTAAVNGSSYSQIGGFVGIAYMTTVNSCYAAGTVTGGSDVGAFVGQCAEQSGTPTFRNCIGWHASLPFYGSNAVSATVTNCYAGNEGSVSSQASSLGWDSGVWDLSSALPVLREGTLRVPAVFIGDSITWQWARTSTSFSEDKLKIPFDASYMVRSGSNILVPFHPSFFSGNGYMDKGISGQNTTQMRSRFQKDIIELNPVVVVIMGGTNDLAQGVSKEQILANISAMAEMASAAGIKVVLCSVTPCNDEYSRLNPKAKGTHIIALNEMIQNYAASKGFTWCNYWPALVADDNLALKVDYRLYDNLHPGPAGYTVMEGIIKPIIDSLL